MDLGAFVGLQRIDARGKPGDALAGLGQAGQVIVQLRAHERAIGILRLLDLGVRAVGDRVPLFRSDDALEFAGGLHLLHARGIALQQALIGLHGVDVLHALDLSSLLAGIEARRADRTDGGPVGRGELRVVEPDAVAAEIDGAGEVAQGFRGRLLGLIVLRLGGPAGAFGADARFQHGARGIGCAFKARLRHLVEFAERRRMKIGRTFRRVQLQLGEGRDEIGAEVGFGLGGFERRGALRRLDRGVGELLDAGERTVEAGLGRAHGAEIPAGRAWRRRDRSLALVGGEFHLTGYRNNRWASRPATSPSRRCR